MNKTCRTLLEKQERTHQRYTLVDPFMRVSKGLVTSLNLFTVLIQDVAWNTCWKRWTIRTSDEIARHDDVDELDSYLSRGFLCNVKCNQHHSGFELASPGTFPMMMMITLPYRYLHFLDEQQSPTRRSSVTKRHDAYLKPCIWTTKTCLEKQLSKSLRFTKAWTTICHL